jgi:transposase
MKCKRKFDGRKLERKALEALRVRTVQQIVDGQSPEVLAKALDMNPATLYKWLAKYHYGGMEALKVKRQPGRPPKLSGEQLSWLASTVREKNPLQLQFPYALWTLAMIREVIRKRFNVRLSEVSVGRIMRLLGFTPQRPLHRAYQQDPVLVGMALT